MANKKRSDAARKQRAKARRIASTPKTQTSGAPAQQARQPRRPPGRATTRKPGRPPTRGRRSRRGLPWAILAGVLVTVSVMVVLFVNRDQPAGQTGATSASDAAIAKAQEVPASTLAQVGVPSDIAAPVHLASDTPLVTIDGKPAVVYIGAEYCPFCAAERWPVVVALSRFGTFTGLGITTSSSTDVHPDTPTFTFHGASYLSPYVTFSSAETQTRTGAPLETLTAEQQRLVATYNVSAVTGSDGAIPFVMVGNLYAWAGASYTPDVLTGMTFEQIANALADPASPTARGIDGTANQITAMICQLTGDQPTEVCGTPSIQQAQSSLPSA
jgi:thiol-disulfide isomerase/thioredoxin